jgi:hypothetical protein
MKSQSQWTIDGREFRGAAGHVNTILLRIIRDIRLILENQKESSSSSSPPHTPPAEWGIRIGKKLVVAGHLAIHLGIHKILPPYLLEVNR